MQMLGMKNLFQELVEGFRLTGEMPESKQFPARLKTCDDYSTTTQGFSSLGKEDDSRLMQAGWVRP